MDHTEMTDQFTARRASLDQLAAMLERQRTCTWDRVAAASVLESRGGVICVRGGQHRIDGSGVTQLDTQLTPTPLADSDLEAKLTIPEPYLRTLRGNGMLDVYDSNVNAWLARTPQRRFLLRALVDRSGHGMLRALLSDKFRIIDNLDVLMAVLGGITAADADAQVVQADLTETRMYVQVRSRGVAAHAPTLLRDYVSPFTRARGADNPLVFAGFVVTNSEVGRGKFTITPRITVQVCTNGVTFTKDGIGNVHLGGQLPEGAVRWSDDTQQAALDLVRMKTRDAVTAFLSPQYLADRIAELEADAGEPISNPAPLIEDVGKELKFSESARAAILTRFTQGADLSSGGVLHAVTAAAQDMDDATEAYHLEDRALPAMRRAAALARTPA